MAKQFAIPKYSQVILTVTQTSNPILIGLVEVEIQFYIGINTHVTNCYHILYVLKVLLFVFIVETNR